MQVDSVLSEHLLDRQALFSYTQLFYVQRFLKLFNSEQSVNSPKELHLPLLSQAQ